MKRIIIITVVLTFTFSGEAVTQIRRGNLMVGADVANLDLTLGGSGTFQASLTPKLGLFFRDKIAAGAYGVFGITTAKEAGTTTNYGAGLFGRYFTGNTNEDLFRQGRFFFEGNAGVEGVSFANGSSTTGLGMGAGPGFSYFISNNVALEALLKYNGIIGFGSRPYQSNVGLHVGFQIYLPGSSSLGSR
jgi:hypothetical protein